MSTRNALNVKVALDEKAARFNVKKNELEANRIKSANYRDTVSLIHQKINF